MRIHKGKFGTFLVKWSIMLHTKEFYAKCSLKNRSSWPEGRTKGRTMQNEIDEIRNLLNKIEKINSSQDVEKFSENYNALELPSIISSIVEFLHPILTPYEIAIYWYLFNESIVKSGDQFIRASTRGLSTIAKSASGKSIELSYGVIKKTLDSLKEKDVISIVGDTNRDGTPYKVFIPDEIILCKEQMKTKSNTESAVIDIKKELDFYNIAENRLRIFERDEYLCHYCHKQLTRFSATLDHIQPVSKGGDNSFDNLITACLHCNSERGNRAVMDFIVKK